LPGLALASAISSWTEFAFTGCRRRGSAAPTRSA
jgi:hypothetical protein